MKQVTQSLRTGQINIADIPIPTIDDKFILVKNTASVISSGTEKTKIDMGKKSLLQKAKARPDLVKQVIKKLKTEGLSKTLQTVKTRLDAPAALGYSSAGTVVAVGGLVTGIQVGDRVACAGADHANHAEFVAIPQNLAAKIPDQVTDQEAAFTTIGAVALQAVRLADAKLGETFLVIGTGLVGQIAVQLLKANGCNVIATDLDASLVTQAQKFGAIGVTTSDDLTQTCNAATAGHGVDGVIICAGSSSNKIIETCGQVTRQKGRVIVAGAVKLDIPREDFFKKEISVTISRSYGPGRYDPEYEEAGNDYPYAYVRFTEQRNMQTILSLIAQKKLDVKSLISHQFPVEDAAKAYQLIQGEKTQTYLAILLTYNAAPTQQRIQTSATTPQTEKIKISALGAGNYATSTLLPNLKINKSITFSGIATSSGRTAQSVAQKFNFQFCASDFNQLLQSDTHAIMVTTRHNNHAQATIKALNAGKHVYVEKPLALTTQQLSGIHKAYIANNKKSQLMVGFNRHFAPATTKIKKFFSGINSPLMVNIRVNAGHIPPDHWVHNPKIGGGRLVGEACHFIELAATLVGSPIKTVYATNTANNSAITNDNFNILLTFNNGSTANIIYTANGATAMPKEFIEVHGGNKSAQINDFKTTTLYQADKQLKTPKPTTQDKGQKTMLTQWVAGLTSGHACLDYNHIINVSLATILAVESLTIGMPLKVNANDL